MAEIAKLWAGAPVIMTIASILTVAVSWWGHPARRRFAKMKPALAPPASQNEG